MATQPTNLPVPSESPRDLKFNAGKIDEFVTSMQREYEDRFGNKHYTIEGLRWIAQQAISTFGYVTLDSFEDGNTLTLPNHVLRLEATGEYYRWDGALPKDVPAGSTPESTGGIGVGAWLSVGDASLRSDLNRETGASIVGTSSGNTVQEELDKVKLKFASFAAMRASTSSEIGDYALLTGWHADYQGYGSGIFQCVDKTDLTDDGGTIAVSSSYAWIRITGHENVTDFGVVPDAGESFDNKKYISAAHDYSSGILIPAGVYHTSYLEFKKKLILTTRGYVEINQIGDDSDLITLQSPDGTISTASQTDGSRIENLVLVPSTGKYGIHTFFNGRGIVSGVEIRGGKGFWFDGVSQYVVTNCASRDSDATGYLITMKKTANNDSIGTWLHLEKSFVANSKESGIKSIHYPSLWIDNPVITNCSTGIECSADSDAHPTVAYTSVKITNGDVDASTNQGIIMIGVIWPQLVGCWVSGGRETASPGVLMRGCRNLVVDGGQFVNNGGHGISLEGCHYGTVSGVMAQNNGQYGINCEYSDQQSELITFSNNNCSTTPENFIPGAQVRGLNIQGYKIAAIGNICQGNTESNYINGAAEKSEVGNITQ